MKTGDTTQNPSKKQIKKKPPFWRVMQSLILSEPKQTKKTNYFSFEKKWRDLTLNHPLIGDSYYIKVGWVSPQHRELITRPWPQSQPECTKLLRGMDLWHGFMLTTLGVVFWGVSILTFYGWIFLISWFWFGEKNHGVQILSCLLLIGKVIYDWNSCIYRFL